MQGLQLIVVLAYYCNDISDLYRGNISNYHNPRCSNAFAFTYSGAIGDAAIDAMIYVLPLPYVWGLRRLRIDQRIGLCFVFGVGIVACVFALLQIPFIIMNYRYRPATGESWFGSQVSLFIAIELALGLIAASLPDLRGLIARTVPGFMAAFRHTDDSSSRPSGDPESGRNSRRRSGQPGRTQPGAISIGGGIMMGGEGVGWGRKVKRPDWMRSDLTSLWRDTPPTSAPPSRGNTATVQTATEDTILEIPIESASSSDTTSNEKPKDSIVSATNVTTPSDVG